MEIAGSNPAGDALLLLTPAYENSVLGVCRIARDFAKVEDQVQFLARTLWARAARHHATRGNRYAGLLRSDGASHAFALLHDRRFDFAVFEQLLHDRFHHLAAFLGMRHFAPLEDDRDLHLVFVL